jgi:hypothetical protein
MLLSDDSAGICGAVVARNAERQVTWVQKQTFCIYDAPSPDTIRKAAEKSAPVNKITEVRVLDPYFYH